MVGIDCCNIKPRSTFATTSFRVKSMFWYNEEPCSLFCKTCCFDNKSLFSGSVFGELLSLMPVTSLIVASIAAGEVSSGPT